MIDTNKLNKKLLKWGGWHYSKEWGAWIDPSIAACRWGDPPNFPNDLNAIFKWLVPPKDDVIESVEFIWFYDPGLRHICRIKYDGDRIILSKPIKPTGSLERDLALAFCLAIEKLIDTDRKQVQAESPLLALRHVIENVLDTETK